MSETLRQKWSSMFVAFGNVATAFLAIATTYFVHYCENNNNNQYNSVTKNFCPSFITSNSNSNNFYCGENGKFCRRSRRNEFDDDEEEDAPNLFNACVHARAKVESQIFGQTESTDILLDAICDKFREIERYELEEEDLGERREDGVEEERQTPLVMRAGPSAKQHQYRPTTRLVSKLVMLQRRRSVLELQFPRIPRFGRLFSRRRRRRASAVYRRRRCGFLICRTSLLIKQRRRAARQLVLRRMRD